MTVEKNAVVVKNACLSFGKGKDASMILDHLNMNVPRGSIYCLLGASGCGKTTLLSCITGRLAVDSGEVRVLGEVPGTEGSGVPGPRVGYMPQELALVDEMDVGNVIYYFGWLFGMTSPQIAKRYVFLSKLLALPDGKMLVKNLSGGQQRRVSLAASLVQTPELLILDEPTVGLDPVLRQNIWDYLIQLSRDVDTTIIITTHYIEEATQAHKVGLMRGGTLLADMAPRVLIANHSCTTLEEVFLKLSQLQGEGFVYPRREQEDANVNPSITEDQDEEIDSSKRENVRRRRSVAYDDQENETGIGTLVETTYSRGPRNSTSSFACRLKALMYKDGLAILRNKWGIILLFVLPIVQIAISLLILGNDSQNIAIGIVNDEISNCPDVIGDIRKHSGVLRGTGNYDKETCHFHGLSCLFIDKLKESTAQKMYFSDTRSALVAAKKGVTSATIHFPSNFSELLEARVTDAMAASNHLIESGRIEVWLDMTIYAVAYKVQSLIYDTYRSISEDLAVACNLDKRTYQMPMRFMEPVYGNGKTNSRDHTVSSMMLGMLFFTWAIETATVISTDRSNGVWMRNLVGGVSATESILSHMLSQVTGIVVQMTEVLLLSFLVFDMDCVGNMIDVIVLVFLQCLAGSAQGLLIGAVSKKSSDALYLITGLYLMCFYLMGISWPLEGAAKLLQYVSYYTPSTLASNSMRNIITRGWGILHPQVLPGYVMSIVWIIGQFVTSVWILGKKM